MKHKSIALHAAIVVVSLMTIAPLCSAQTEHPAYGIFADFDANFHNANFQQLPGIPSCCPRYGSGTGSGFAAGVEYRVGISSRVDLQFRAMYQTQDASLISTQSTTVLRNGSATAGTFQYEVDGSLANAGVEALAGIRTLSDELHVMGGFHFGYVTVKTFSQSETITQPSDGVTFLDSAGNDTHSRIRNQYSGAIPDAASFQIAAVVGVSYDLQINPQATMFLIPEIFYSYALTNVASATSWRANALRFGVSVCYSPIPPTILHQEPARGNH